MEVETSDEAEIALQLLNIQETQNGVVRQLERLERLYAGFERGNSLSKHEIGDRNHVTVQDNVAALSVKLQCLQSILDYYAKPHWKAVCGRNFLDWYRKRRGYHLPLMIHMVINCVEACFGTFKAVEIHREFTQEQVEQFTTKLLQANEDFQCLQAHVKHDPRSYIGYDQLYKVTYHDTGVTFDVQETMALLTEDLNRTIFEQEQKTMRELQGRSKNGDSDKPFFPVSPNTQLPGFKAFYRKNYK